MAGEILLLSSAQSRAMKAAKYATVLDVMKP